MNINELGNKIKLARKWAKIHFKAHNAGDLRLVDDDLNLILGFFVEFPDADRMRVSPSIMGRPHPMWFEYRLSFYPELAWVGKHPIWETEMPPLVVTLQEV